MCSLVLRKSAEKKTQPKPLSPKRVLFEAFSASMVGNGEALKLEQKLGFSYLMLKLKMVTLVGGFFPPL